MVSHKTTLHLRWRTGPLSSAINQQTGILPGQAPIDVTSDGESRSLAREQRVRGFSP